MKTDKKTIIAIVLGVVAVGLILYQFKGAFSSAKTRIRIASSVPAVTLQSDSAASQPRSSTPSSESGPTRLDGYTALIAKLEESDIAFENRNFKNPMRPLVSDAGARRRKKASGPATKVSVGPTDALSMGYTIEGIVWNQVDPLALVNDQVVGVNEKLKNGALITEITPDTVRFTKNGKRYYLVLREE